MPDSVKLQEIRLFFPRDFKEEVKDELRRRILKASWRMEG